MAKALSSWKVLPHGPLERSSDHVLTVVGEFNMPLTRFERRMTVVRLTDGRLVIFSAIALDDARMQELEAFGTPAFLVIPNHLHRSDARIWKERYPQLIVVAPKGARKAAEEVVPVDTSQPDFGDPNLRFLEVAGTRGRDAALEWRDESGVTLVTNDIIGHMPAKNGWVLRVMGFAGEEPRIPRVVRLALINDKRALRTQLEAWAELPITRILVSHGDTIVNDPPRVLRQLAATL
jgi:hypothetical protein